MLPKDIQFHLKCRPGDIGRYVILTGDPKRVKNIAECLDDPALISDNREFTLYTGFLLKQKVSVCSTGIGGPSAAIAIEELAACGAEYMIRIGTCGGISETVLGGDIVIPTAAVRQEGTTQQYVPAEYPAVADFTVVSSIIKAADEFCAKTHVGVVQSKDSFYGQHSPETMPASYELCSKWQAWKAAGVLASEMECSTLFVVGGIRKVKTGAVLLSIWNQEREKSGLSNPICEDTELAIKIAVSAIEKLIRCF